MTQHTDVQVRRGLADGAEMINLRSSLTGLVVVAMLLTACGSGSPDSLAFADGPEGMQLPEDLPVEELVAFQARWVCELQRRTFPSLDDLDEALDESLAGAAISRVDYERFIEVLDDFESLRIEVRDAYLETCAA